MLCRLPQTACTGRTVGPARAARCLGGRVARATLVMPKATATTVVKKDEDVENNKAPKKDAEEEEFQHDIPDPKVSSKQVAAFLSTLVEETDIAELHLKVGTFDLKVRRSTASAAAHAAAAPAPAAHAASSAVEVAPAASAEPVAPTESIDESLIYVNSPKVGIFRTGKYAGGKRVGKGNMVNVGDQVKKGQALAYVEQLGTHFPVEAPQAGEVAKFMIEDGAPVEYQQLVVEIAPFFGGHIIGDKKYA